VRILVAALLAVAGTLAGEEKPSPAPLPPIEIPLGASPTVDGRSLPDEWKDAVRQADPAMTVYLKHDGLVLYVACDCPFAFTGSEAVYLLLDADGSGSPTPAGDDLQLSYSPYSLLRLPWIESRGDGRSWVAVPDPSGWTAKASTASPERLQVEFAVSLARLGPGEHPEARVGILMTGALSLACPGQANLYTPSSWSVVRLAGGVESEPARRLPQSKADLFDLKDRLPRAKEAREAFEAARVRQEELVKRQEPPKTQAEAVALRQGVEAAVQGYARAVSLDPDNPILQFARGSFHVMLGDLETARQSLEAAYTLAPGVSRIASRLYEISVQSNGYARALELAEAEVARRGDRPDGYLMRGQIRMALQDLDAAVADLARAGTFTLDSRTGRMADAILDQAKALQAAWTAEAAARKRDEAKGDLPRAEIVTERGRIVVELFEDDAPNTVANFLSLAEGRFFDGMRFHRVLGDFMAQAGDPFSRNPEEPRIGSGGPGYRIQTQTGERHHWRGTLSMANAGKDTDGSQFFITVKPVPHLDGKHAVFGRVLEGQDVVERLKPWDLITSIRVLRKREHPYTIEKLEGPPPDPRP
jgi:cyclophilin family peptidyl-prolyl cis-trans isomerase